MKTSTADASRIRQIARSKFGYDALRFGQEEAIRLVLGGHDTLSVMPTGSGKSAIYQIAALLIDGPTVVISPLIALQKDQVGSIREQEIAGAAVLNSTLRVGERRETLSRLDGGEARIPVPLARTTGQRRDVCPPEGEPAFAVCRGRGALHQRVGS